MVPRTRTWSSASGGRVLIFTRCATDRVAGVVDVPMRRNARVRGARLARQTCGVRKLVAGDQTSAMARLAALPRVAAVVAPPAPVVAPHSPPPPPPPQPPQPSPTARAWVAGTFADLPPAYQKFATQHELTFRDVLGLLSAPTVHDHLTVHRLAVLVAQLEEAAQNGMHQMCEMMLCVLIKRELVHLCDATTACDLRCLVTRLEREWRDAGTVGAAPLARLGRVLLVKLDNVG